jgi:hypothetical protein
LQQVNPYQTAGFFNPPWLAWMLSPLGVLTAVDAHVLWIVLILLLTMRCVYALGGSWLSVVLTVVSPGFLVSIMNGQVDVLVLFGLLTGSWLLIIIKPQVAGLAILYDVIVRRRIDWTAVFVFTATLIIFLAFFTLPQRNVFHDGVNISLWPWGIPFGVVLFGLSLLRRDKWLAVLATFFCAPYLSGNSLIVYSAVGTSRYGYKFAILFSMLLWARGLHWFI